MNKRMTKDELIKSRYWEYKTLEELSEEEWELLCDGCGHCCLTKLIDEETDELVYTNVACNLLDLKSCSCSNYLNRHEFEPDCIKLDVDKAKTLPWLPETCAYRRVAENRPLPFWHPLLTGNKNKMHRYGKSIKGKVIHERYRGDWEDHIVVWKL